MGLIVACCLGFSGILSGLTKSTDLPSSSPVAKALCNPSMRSFIHEGAPKETLIYHDPFYRDSPKRAPDFFVIPIYSRFDHGSYEPIDSNIKDQAQRSLGAMLKTPKRGIIQGEDRD